jgi:hypothetical protein
MQIGYASGEAYSSSGLPELPYVRRNSFSCQWPPASSLETGLQPVESPLQSQAGALTQSLRTLALFNVAMPCNPALRSSPLLSRPSCVSFLVFRPSHVRQAYRYVQMGMRTSKSMHLTVQQRFDSTTTGTLQAPLQQLSLAATFLQFMAFLTLPRSMCVFFQMKCPTYGGPL